MIKLESLLYILNSLFQTMKKPLDESSLRSFRVLSPFTTESSKLMFPHVKATSNVSEQDMSATL